MHDIRSMRRRMWLWNPAKGRMRRWSRPSSPHSTRISRNRARIMAMKSTDQEMGRTMGEAGQRHRIVQVALGDRSYEIVIGRELLAGSGARIADLGARAAAIITDEHVGDLHAPALAAMRAEAGLRVTTISVSPGEASKAFATLEHVCGAILDARIERGDLVIALGGGVVGDLAGFAAAIVRRGIRFVQVPTSLLAQVDSSVGGKTGINAPQGKNLIGAFHQPSLVLADTTVLDSLPERDFLAGYGEVVKYGLLGDCEFFQWLEGHASSAADGDMAARTKIVKRSVQMKADIVVRDETEQGDRALLNLGHTFCHALEAATGYSDRLLHGEGVAIGCAVAFELSSRLGLCSQEDPSRVRAHLRDVKMKVDLSDIAGELPDADGLLALMAQDKKVVDGTLNFVLARGIGHAFVTGNVPRDTVKAVLQDALAQRG